MIVNEANERTIQRPIELFSSIHSLEPPSVVLLEDVENAKLTLGKTGYFHPGEKVIYIYITDRHIKDVLKTVAHEFIHYLQGEENTINWKKVKSPNIIDCKYTKDLEADAYLNGAIMFREMEERIKTLIKSEK